MGLLFVGCLRFPAGDCSPLVRIDLFALFAIGSLLSCRCILASILPFALMYPGNSPRQSPRVNFETKKARVICWSHALSDCRLFRLFSRIRYFVPSTTQLTVSAPMQQTVGKPFVRLLPFLGLSEHTFSLPGTSVGFLGLDWSVQSQLPIVHVRIYSVVRKYPASIEPPSIASVPLRH